MTLTRRSLLAAPGLLRAQPHAASRPNILLILMDDMAARSLSCYGNPYVKTPHLDRLAEEGVRFTNAYATPQCTPTRASLLTGQSTARNRMWHVIPWYAYPWARVQEPDYVENLPRGAFTLAKELKAAGYATACLGKWHLTANPDGDYTALFPQGAPHYGFDRGWPRPSQELIAYDRAVDALTGSAIGFIEENRNRPWFCYLSHHAIHRALAAPPALVEKYRRQGFPETGLNNATLLASMEHMDAGIGRVLARLDEWKLRENTAVIFLTDNGGIHRSYLPVPVRQPGGGWRLKPGAFEFDSTPLREGKGFCYEGGIRVPMIVRWPERIKPGRVEETPAHVVDLLPTLFSMAGARAPEGYVLDGVNLQPLLEGRARAPQRSLYWYMPLYDIRWCGTPCAAVRHGDYKLIEYFGDSFDNAPEPNYRLGRRLELYDLKRDPGEARDLAGQMPERVQAMERDLHAWIHSCGAAVPELNPRYDPHPAALQL